MISPHFLTLFCGGTYIFQTEHLGVWSDGHYVQHTLPVSKIENDSHRSVESNCHHGVKISKKYKISDSCPNFAREGAVVEKPFVMNLKEEWKANDDIEKVTPVKRE